MKSEVVNNENNDMPSYFDNEDDDDEEEEDSRFPVNETLTELFLTSTRYALDIISVFC